MREAAPVLAVDGVDAGYGALQVLSGVSLTVGPGEIVSLIGPNGAGKTTVIRAILGLVPVRGWKGEGTIRFQDRRIDGRPPEEIVTRGIGVVPEGARVFPEMSVLDNLRMGAMTARARAREAGTLAEAFAMFPRLQERQRQLARTLSGGERQMLAIGRALMSAPDLLLLDEPSLGLQPSLVSFIMGVIQTINARGVSVLLVEQNVHVSLSISHRGYVLEQGRIVLEDAGPALLGNPHVRVSYLGA